jgi:hypothetical protein
MFLAFIPVLAHHPSAGKQFSLYLTVSSTILPLITKSNTPITKKKMAKAVNVSIVLIAVGTGLHAGRVCYLNLEAFNFSIFSLIFAFSSGEVSILLFLIFNYKIQINFLNMEGFWGFGVLGFRV